MTTYRYTLNLNDCEVHLIKSSLDLMIEFSEDMIKEDKMVPYYSHLLTSKALKEKLYENTTLMSTNNFSNIKSKSDWKDWLNKKIESLKRL
ncbi:MAG: hypothetical protein RLY43_419 [Bacteroidota bacterium]|jgi:hypothetical protein